MFFQDGLHLIMRTYKIPFIVQIENCLEYEVPTYNNEKNAKVVLEHIATILLNFAVLWKNPKKDSTPQGFYMIARTKVRDIMHMILRVHADKADIIFKILVAYGTIAKTDAGFVPSVEPIIPFLSHPDTKIVACANYIIQLSTATIYYKHWYPEVKNVL